MKKEINIIRSETWLTSDLVVINEILQETINSFVKDEERIINIEMKTDSSGLSRFWIYTEKLKVLIKNDQDGQTAYYVVYP